MLARENRLKKNRDFERLFKTGKTIKNEAFTMRFAANNQGAARFGFIVGLKISKKAVVRNSIRRQFSEAARKLVNQIREGYDIVIIPRDAAAIGSEILFSQLAEAFKRAGILKND